MVIAIFTQSCMLFLTVFLSGFGFLAAFTNFINITSVDNVNPHYAIGSQASFRCTIDERKFNFSRVYLAICHETENCSIEGKHYKNLTVISETRSPKTKTRTTTVRVEKILPSWCGRVFAVCIGKNGTHNEEFKVIDVLFGMKPNRPTNIDCLGHKFSKLVCKISPLYSDPKCNYSNESSDSTHVAPIAVSMEFKDSQGRSWICKNSSSSDFSSLGKFSSCSYFIKESTGILIVNHKRALFRGVSINVSISYCNAYGCEVFKKVISRVSSEQATPVKLLDKKCSSNSCLFFIDGSARPSTLIYEYKINCTSSYAKTSSMIKKSSKVTVEDLAPGTKYNCSLNARPTPVGRWSRSSTVKIVTEETRPASGPIWKQGYFSRNHHSTRLYFVPPPHQDIHGKLLGFGYSFMRDGSSIKSCKSLMFCDVKRNGENGLIVYLFTKNSQGWSRRPTLVHIKPQEKDLPSDQVVLWGHSNSNIYNVKCPLKYKRCNIVVCKRETNKPCRHYPDFWSGSPLRTNLTSEQVSGTVMNKDGRSSTLDIWVHDHCVKNENPKLKSDWFSAVVESTSTKKMKVKVSMESVLFGCSPLFRWPLSSVLIRSECNSTDFHQKRNLTRNPREKMSSISFEIPRFDYCTHTAGIEGRKTSFVQLTVTKSEVFHKNSIANNFLWLLILLPCIFCFCLCAYREHIRNCCLQIWRDEKFAPMTVIYTDHSKLYELSSRPISSSDPSVDQALDSFPTCTTRLTNDSTQNNDFPSSDRDSATYNVREDLPDPSACKTSLSNVPASSLESDGDSDSSNYYTGQIMTEIPVFT